jgi:hypothetical protein
MSLDYVMDGDDDNPTVFKVRNLTGAEHMQCIYLAETGQSVEAVRLAVELGLKGWSNFGDVEFSKDQDDNLACLNYQQLVDIGQEIMRITRLEDEEKKN